jgi:hypothetical protein
MLSKSHSLLLAACGGSALVALSCGSFANAQVIYSDTFARTGALLGSSPSPVNSGGAYWLGSAGTLHNTTAQTNGTELTLAAASGQYAIASATLPFTPPASGSVTLSADMEVGAVSTTNGWGLIGFSPTGGSDQVANGSYAAGPTLQLLTTGQVLLEPNTFTGANPIWTGIPYFSNTTFYHFSIDYNLSAQTVQWYLGSGANATELGSYDYAANPGNTPAISYVEVGMYGYHGDSPPETVSFQNFQLSTAPVPEPVGSLNVFPDPGLNDPKMQFNTGQAVDGNPQLSPILPNIPDPLSGWFVAVWHRNEVLNASEMVTNDPGVQDPVLGTAAYAFTTPNQNAQLAIYRDTINSRWVYNLFERNGTLTPAGGANLFLEVPNNSASVTMNHPIIYSLYAKIAKASVTYDDPQAMTNGAVLAQVFTGFILKFYSPDPSQNITLFMQIHMADSRGPETGGIFDEQARSGSSGVVYTVDFVPPGGNPLAFATDNGPLHYLSYEINPFLTQFLAHPLASAPLSVGAENPANWSLNSMYLGLETENSIAGGAPQGSVSVGLQVSDLSVFSEPVPEPTTLSLAMIGIAALALCKRRRREVDYLRVSGSRGCGRAAYYGRTDPSQA